MLIALGSPCLSSIVTHHTHMSASCEIVDGTWTLNVRHKRRGVWLTWLTRSSILHPRFKRARFVLAEERSILICAEQLRGALRRWLSDPKGRSIRQVRIDIEKGTVDGSTVKIDNDV